MLQDAIVQCRHCKTSICYQTIETNIVKWSCITCGFQTNTLLMKGTDAVKSFEESLPQIYIDLKYVDEEGFVWYPSTINIEDKGIIFPDPIDGDWRWAVVFAVPVEEHEKTRFPVPGRKGEYQKFKTDMSCILHYDKDKYMYAIQALGLI